jgi:hypothetical protein
MGSSKELLEIVTPVLLFQHRELVGFDDPAGFAQEYSRPDRTGDYV